MSQDHRTGGREFQISGDATEKLRAPNAVHADRMTSRLVLDELRVRAGV